MSRLSRPLRYAGLALLVLVLAAGPFFRGLFFWTELLTATALLSLGFLLWLSGRKLAGVPVRLTGGAPGMALLALVACYLIQFAWAVYPRGNLDWVLRVTVAFFVYVMVRAEAGPALRRWLAWVLVLSAGGMAFMGFLEFAGYFAKDPEMMRALGLVNLGDRMATPLQYPNTAAVYFLAAVLSCVGLALEDLKRWKLTVATCLITLISVAFFFTVSRGAVVVLPFGLLLFFIGLGREKRWPGLLLLVAAWIPTIGVLKAVGVAASVGDWLMALSWVGAGTAAGAIAGLVLSYFLALKGRVQVAIVASGLALLALAVLGLSPSGGFLPKQAVRLLDMNFRTSSVTARLTFDRDALSMLKDRPMGRGGWGWDRSYRQYQESYYIARETHNHYLQTAVEAGVPGLLALSVAMGSAILSAWTNRQQNALGWALATGAGLLAGHSLIDFNLSYGLVWVLLWGSLASATTPLGNREQRRAWSWGVAGVAFCAAVIAVVLGIGSWYSDKATQLAEESHPEAAHSAALQAARFDPLNSAPLLLIADLPAFQKAARLDPDLTNPHWQLAILYANQQDWVAAHLEARLTLEKHPLVTAHYTKLASIAGTRLNRALHDGDTNLARQMSIELTDLGAEMIRRTEVAAQTNGAWMGPPLVMTPEFKLRYGQALFLTGHVKEALPHLTDASKVGLLGSEADLWLYIIYERMGDSEAMTALETKPWIRFRNANPSYNFIRAWKP